MFSILHKLYRKRESEEKQGAEGTFLLKQILKYYHVDLQEAVEIILKRYQQEHKVEKMSMNVNKKLPYSGFSVPAFKELN